MNPILIAVPSFSARQMIKLQSLNGKSLDRDRRDQDATKRRYDRHGEGVVSGKRARQRASAKTGRRRWGSRQYCPLAWPRGDSVRFRKPLVTP
jgi:hypothetical protein